MSHPFEYGVSYSYDNAAGVGFNQWEVSAYQHDTTEWHRRPPNLAGTASGMIYGAVSTATSATPTTPTIVGERFGPLLYLRKKGARSLFDMAIRVVADKVATLEIGDLDGVPFRIACHIWDLLVGDSKPVPLQSFLVLATCLTKQQRQHEREMPMPRGLFLYNYAVQPPFYNFGTYIKPLRSHSFDFIVHLIFAHTNTLFSEYDFLALSDLKNLGVLEIIQPSLLTLAQFPRITDSIIRYWAEVPNPFPVLRVLRIWGYDCTTFRSLNYLNNFPSLAVYDVTGRLKDWELEQQSQFLDPDWNWERVTYYPRPADGSIFRAFYERYPTPLFVPLWMMDSSSEQLSFARTSGVRHYETSIETQKVKIIRRDCIPFLSQAATLTPQQLDSICAKVCLHYLAYMLYCQVGRSWSDKDLVAQGVSDADKAFVMDNRHVIPPRPYVTVNFGSCCKHTCRRWDWRMHSNPNMACPCESYSRAPGQARSTFIRKNKKTRKRHHQSSSGNLPSDKDGPSDNPTSGPRLRKKRRKFSMADL
ncbi:hypothetical protein F4811DRAFT_552701 [Daldinia bambusicola]|nr:hypothetical protein F4811DRAFT_552701 [Daldinia bambusicola]